VIKNRRLLLAINIGQKHMYTTQPKTSLKRRSAPSLHSWYSY